MNPFSPSAPRPHNLTLFLLAALLAPAASVEFLTSSDPPALTVGPAEVQSSLLQSLTCAGYTVAGPSLLIPDPLGQGNALRVPPITRFPGANPDCRISGELPLPGRRNHYGAAPVESALRYRRAVLRELWPGVDAAVEHLDGRFRLSFRLESAAHAGLIRLKPDGAAALSPRFSHATATLRAEELTPYGPQPIPVERLAAEAPFRIPAPTPHPVRIILEVPAAENEPGPYFSRRDESGDRYELNGRSIRRFSPTGELRFETILEGFQLSDILPTPSSLLVTGRSFATGATLVRLDPASGRVLATTSVGSSTEIAVLPQLDTRGRIHLFAAPVGIFLPISCDAFLRRSCSHVTLTSDGQFLRRADAPTHPVLTPEGDLLNPAAGLPPGFRIVSAVADRTGAVWVSAYRGATARLFYRNTEVPGIEVAGQLTLDGDDLFLFASPASACAGPDPNLFRLSLDGVIRQSVWLPPGLDYDPGRAHLPSHSGDGIRWARHVYDPAAPAPPAYLCTPPAGLTPDPFLTLPVRGVEDASPWTSPAPYPTDLRGWSILFDGRPAGIVSLTRDAVTVLPPPDLSGGVEVETTYRGRRTARYYLSF